MFNHAINLKPDSHVIHYLKGSVLIRLGWYRAALESFETANQLYSGDEIILCALASAHDDCY